MGRRVLLTMVALGSLFALAALWLGVMAGEPGAENRPQVVLIMINTLRADRLGSYGFERYVSPELDAMSREGVRFANTVAQCSWTRPSIGSFLTSRYPRELGEELSRETIEQLGSLGYLQSSRRGANVAIRRNSWSEAC